MKTYKTMLKEQLTPFQLAKARMDYEDSKKPYKPVVIPKDMKYPKSGLKGTSLKAFLFGIMP